ncbi:MAG: lipid-A-disaccharide synthase [Thermoguttaceae bacterium]
MSQNRKLTLFFSAGEPSGDLHGANLIRELRRRAGGLQAVGYGGPQMAAAGCQLHADLTALAVMWFSRALANLRKFWGLLVHADRFFRHHRPDAVVLIDYPGFNWWIARRAKAHGIPVFYYVPPQLWAWAQWRVRKMRRLVDHVLCCLPFEETWFRQHGCQATLVGHPFFDELSGQQLDEAFLAQMRWGRTGVLPVQQPNYGQDAQARRPGPLVTILPGSRRQEVTHNLPWFLKAAAHIRAAVPEAWFAVAAFRPDQAELACKQVAATGLPIEVFAGKTPELIHAADCCMAVSGSVSLELLYHTKPTVILYWISKAAYWGQRFLRKVKYITLVNLLATGEIFSDDLAPFDPGQEGASRVLFPEYLTCEDKSAQIATHIVRWLTDRPAREALVARLARLKAQVAFPGASGRAAEYLLGRLGLHRRPVPPHFVRPAPGRPPGPRSRRGSGFRVQKGPAQRCGGP